MEVFEGKKQQQQKRGRISFHVDTRNALRHSVAKSRVLPAQLGAIETEKLREENQTETQHQNQFGVQYIR